MNPRAAATILVLAALGKVAAAQTPIINISPSSGSYPIGTQLTISITYCAPAGWFDGPAGVTFNGQSVVNDFPFVSGYDPGCTDYATSQGIVTIAAGQNSFHTEVTSSPPGGYGDASASYTGTGATMSVSVTPDGEQAPQRVANAAGYTQIFTVTNTGEGPDTYTFNCSGTGLTCTNRTPTGATLQPSGQVTVTATYTTGSPGTGQLYLAAYGTDTDSGSFTVPIAVMSVSVTPDGNTAATLTPGSQDSVLFTVQNTGGASDTYTFTCSGTYLSCTSFTPTSAALAPSQSTTVKARYTVHSTGIPSGSSAQVTLGATGLSTNTGWYQVPIARVSVVPVITEVAHPSGGGVFVDSFTVTNTGSAPATFSFTCAGLSLVCTPSSASLALQPSTPQKIGVYLNTEAPGLVGLALKATSSVVTDSGSMLVNITTPPAQPELPGPGIVILPAPHTRSNATLRVVVDWCSYHPNHYNPSSRVIRLNGVDVTAQFTTVGESYNACHDEENVANDVYERSVGVVQLAPGENVLRAEVQMLNPAYGGVWEQASFTLSGGAPEGADVRVVASGQYAEVQTGSGKTQTFTVMNTGVAAGDFTITASCTGSLSSCSVAPGGLSLAASSQGTGTVTFTAGSVGSTGRITLRASVPGGGGTRQDSSWTDVVVAAVPAPGVVLVQTTDVLERDLCVTVAAGDAAASECGDLRLVHSLPATRTRNTARAPALIYNSRHAMPYPVVAANVTVPVVPDSVIARLLIGGVERARGSWPGASWQLNWANRITVGFPFDTASTGVYAYTLEVRRKTAGVETVISAPTGQMLIVNRRASPFGAGWWVAGVEQLLFLPSNAVLWVGGDGSVRRYTKVAGQDVWLAPNVDRPDSITRTAGPVRYYRHLRNGLRVHFDSVTYGGRAIGRHIKTVNRLAQETNFTYHATILDRLLTIVLPPSSSPKTYTFAYNASTSRLDSVIAPPIGSTVRATKVTMTGTRLTTIRDPDLKSVTFVYGTGADTTRVIRRQNRRGYSTRFGYNAAKGLRADSIELAASSWAITTLEPTETRAFSTSGLPGVAQRADTVYSQMDGPRTDVADVTRIWVNAYGAPLRIRNALGDETRVVYDGTWPALATRTIAPNGFETQATYHATRGLPNTTVALNPLGNGQNATSAFLWHSKWDMSVRATSPTGIVDTTAYDLTTGNRLWQGRGVQTASFTYHSSGAASGLLRTISVAGLPAESLIYNGLGNLSRTRTPIGFVSVIYSDAIGRDTLVYSPIDSATGRDSAQVVANGSRARTRFDVMSRVIEAISWGPSRTVPGGTRPADSVRVVNLYDAEGNDTSTTRHIPKAGGTLTPRQRWVYDRANRVTEEASVGVSFRRYVLDPAGNAESTVTARGHSLSAKYDALNRPLSRITPQVAYSNIPCSSFLTWPCFFTIPTRDNSICIRADTAVFGYDHAGNMVRADNWAARIRRSYKPSGLPSSEDQTVRTYAPEVAHACEPPVTPNPAAWTQHAYSLSYDYDLEGRRTRLWHPIAIDPCPGQCSEQFTYSPSTGNIATITDVLGNVHQFAFDAAGRLRSRRAPGSWLDTMTYDNDGRALTRALGSYSAETLRYDALGRVTNAAMTNFANGGAQASVLTYGGLGALAHATGLSFGATVEEFWTDAVGNRTRQRDYGVDPQYMDRQRVMSYDAYGRHTLIRDTLSPSPEYATYYVSQYDGSGNVDRNYGWEVQAGVRESWVRVSFYGADEQLRVHNTHRDSLIVSGAGGSFEEYRYDALGRRVLVRSRDTGTCNEPSTSSCGHIERTVWDGSQVLYEIRARGGDGATATQLEYDHDSGDLVTFNRWGRVLYQHGGGIDLPVNIIRMNMDGQPAVIAVSPHANWQGDFEIGSLMNGTSTASCTGQSGCPTIPFPGGRIPADGGRSPLSYGWFGNLISGKLDGSGLQYMRNRYYDPSTGRFTQEDPIGLAGGVNLYGFASGDPVNFSDPFGLKVIINSPALQRAVDALISGSKTFRMLYEAMNNAPERQLTFTIMEGSRQEVLRFSAGFNRDAVGHTVNGIRGSTSMVRSDRIGSEEVAHEFLHGGANLPGVINEQNGLQIPGRCADHRMWDETCRGILNTIMNEMNQSQVKQGKGDRAKQ